MCIRDSDWERDSARKKGSPLAPCLVRKGERERASAGEWAPRVEEAGASRGEPGVESETTAGRSSPLR